MNCSRLTISLIILCFLLPALSGCQNTATLYLGKQVAAEEIVPIPGGVAKETWQTDDLTLQYGYQEDGDHLNISGQVTLADQYSAIYHKLSRLDIYLVFLDHDSRVLATAVLLRNSTYTFDETIKFAERLVMPSDAVSFSFAYDGSAVEFGKNGNQISFWHHPK